jgi:hypothetical protein
MAIITVNRGSYSRGKEIAEKPAFEAVIVSWEQDGHVNPLQIIG